MADKFNIQTKYVIILSFFLISSTLGGIYYYNNKTSNKGPIPIIYADPTPYKFKPEDPGGMVVANLDKMIYENFHENSKDSLKIEKILPKPEAPLLSKANSSNEIDSDIDTTPNSELQTITSLIQKQNLVHNQKTLLSEDIKEAKDKYLLKKQEKSGYKIQLGIYPSKDKAEKNWFILQKKYPSQLEKLMPLIQIKDIQGKSKLYHLQAGYIVNKNNARSLCKQLNSKGQSCFLAQ